MKSIGNGWKMAEQARRRAWIADAEIRANAQREKVRKDFIAASGIDYYSEMIKAFNSAANIGYIGAYGFGQRNAIQNDDTVIPPRKPTTWQRFKNWLA